MHSHHFPLAPHKLKSRSSNDSSKKSFIQKSNILNMVYTFVALISEYEKQVLSANKEQIAML